MVNVTQMHNCSDFCLRPKRKRKHQACHSCASDISSLTGKTKNKKRRKCRNGFGKEFTPDGEDTPGRPISDKLSIESDTRGFPELYMERNHPKMVQSSMDIVRSWRANCDVQILLYKSDPMRPDPAEIAKITDYIVAYACKGNATMATERKQIREIIMR